LLPRIKRHNRLANYYADGFMGWKIFGDLIFDHTYQHSGNFIRRGQAEMRGLRMLHYSLATGMRINLSTSTPYHTLTRSEMIMELIRLLLLGIEENMPRCAQRTLFERHWSPRKQKRRR
jgi:hypothetical protein